ncbi:MAG: hypothetical protein M5R36_25415 [Deltaproteobacteria bacterium]|nr:hypothetical protein [Deltaproteobacteria bacterium]
MELKGDRDELAERLETKADFFQTRAGELLSQLADLSGIWMSASLHKLGYGYETFYFAMRGYPVPDDLDDEGKKEYVRRLDQRIKNLLLRAEDAYRRNLGLVAEYGLNSPWAEKSAERLKALEAFRRGAAAP